MAWQSIIALQRDGPRRKRAIRLKSAQFSDRARDAGQAGSGAAELVNAEDTQTRAQSGARGGRPL